MYEDLIKFYIYNSILSKYNIKINNILLTSNINNNYNIIRELQKIDNFFIKLNNIYNNILISDIFIGNSYNNINIIQYNDNLIYYYINRLYNIYNSRTILCISNDDKLSNSIKYYNNNIIIHKNIPLIFYDTIIVDMNNDFNIYNHIYYEYILSKKLIYYYSLIYNIRLNGHLILYLNQTILTNNSINIIYNISKHFENIIILSHHNREICNNRFNLIIIFRNKINKLSDYNYKNFKQMIINYYIKLINNYYYSINNITYNRDNNKNIKLISGLYYKNIYLSQILSSYLFNIFSIDYNILYNSIKLINISVKEEIYDIRRLKKLDKYIYYNHIENIMIDTRYIIINNRIKRYYYITEEHIYKYISKIKNISINKLWLDYNNIINFLNIINTFRERLNVYYLGDDINIIDNCFRYNIYKSNTDVKYMRYEYINYLNNIIDNDKENIKLYNYLCKTIDVMICNIIYNNKDIIKYLIFLIYNMRENGICIIRYIKYSDDYINKLYNILINQFNNVLIYRPIQNIYDNDYYIICINYNNKLTDIEKEQILNGNSNIEIKYKYDIRYLNNEINIRNINNLKNQIYEISNYFNMDMNMKKKLRLYIIKNRIKNILNKI